MSFGMLKLWLLHDYFCVIFPINTLRSKLQLSCCLYVNILLHHHHTILIFLNITGCTVNLNFTPESSLFTSLHSSVFFSIKTHFYGRYSRIHNVHEIFFSVKTKYNDLSKIFVALRFHLCVMYKIFLL